MFYVGWLHLVLIAHNAVEWEPTIGVLFGVFYLCISALAYVLLGIVFLYFARRSARRLIKDVKIYTVALNIPTSDDDLFGTDFGDEKQ